MSSHLSSGASEPCQINPSGTHHFSWCMGMKQCSPLASSTTPRLFVYRTRSTPKNPRRMTSMTGSKPGSLPSSAQPSTSKSCASTKSGTFGLVSSTSAPSSSASTRNCGRTSSPYHGKDHTSSMKHSVTGPPTSATARQVRS